MWCFRILYTKLAQGVSERALKQTLQGLYNLLPLDGNWFGMALNVLDSEWVGKLHFPHDSFVI